MNQYRMVKWLAIGVSIAVLHSSGAPAQNSQVPYPASESVTKSQSQRGVPAAPGIGIANQEQKS
ncbi:MAG TPA: hypothetical protein VEC99_04305, partial [Clostridia bacterium]|nr:hypothetical protein [Clostridia bacterium]